MSHLNLKCPPHVAWLGYGGLVPFIGLAMLRVADPYHSVIGSDALRGYGAVILSFPDLCHFS